MSYQTDHIQSMISEIDRVLRQTRSRKFWTIFSRYSLHRQLLERCRNFLVMQQRPQSVNLVAQPPSPNLANTASANTVIAGELQRLRQDVMESLRSDVAVLGNHRATLQEEIQALMLQKVQLESDCNAYRQNLAANFPALSQSSSRSSAMDETEIARLQAIRDRTDFLLTSMDSSLQLAFGSMQKNVEVYQATLHTGLDRMHHLGYQGEVLFSTLVNRLAQQVGREMMAATTNDRSKSSLTDLSSLNELNTVNELNRVSSPNYHQDWPTDLSSNTTRAVDDLYHIDSLDSSTDSPTDVSSSRQAIETSIGTSIGNLDDQMVDSQVDKRSDQSSMRKSPESIDSFFADFKAFDEDSRSDRSLSPVTPSKEPHSSDSMSSPKIRPQQVDVMMDLSDEPLNPSQPSQKEFNAGETVTMETLFGSPEEISVAPTSGNMTLADIDQLFADLPSL